VHSPDERLEIATVDKFWRLLREVVKSKEFRRARHRIVMIHIPPVDERMAEQDPATVKEMLEWRGNEHWGRLLLPVLNGAKIDALFSAHQHSFHLLPALKGVHDFPIVINDRARCSSAATPRESTCASPTSTAAR